ncbi:MAG: hypothetical protein FWG50_06670 [Kiritimatiellaeota bacterium]|nr:hypothetical protein [Kiritimatiellota bacterium]
MHLFDLQQNLRFAADDLDVFASMQERVVQTYPARDKTVAEKNRAAEPDSQALAQKGHLCHVRQDIPDHARKRTADMLREMPQPVAGADAGGRENQNTHLHCMREGFRVSKRQQKRTESMFK